MKIFYFIALSLCFARASFADISKIIVCDLGGTNLRFAEASLDGEQIKIANKISYKVQGVSNQGGFVEMLQKYLDDLGEPNEVRAIAKGLGISFAGAVSFEEEASATNLRLNLSRKQLEQELGLPVRIINDGAAAAEGIPFAGKGGVSQIKGGPSREGRHALIVPGTGLGVAFLETDPAGKCLSVATEQGHYGLPEKKENLEWKSFLLDQYSDGFDMEDAVSGRAFPNYFGFLERQGVLDGLKIDSYKKVLSEDKDRFGEYVYDMAKQGDATALAIIHFFWHNLAQACGHIGGTMTSFGGVYLSGNIVNKLYEWFDEDAFLSAYNLGVPNKLRNVAKSIPVYKIEDGDLTLKGVAAYMKRN